jgi:molybdenum cofactor synthesis domain-containing protein
MTSIKAVVVTVSDTRTAADDISGDKLVELLSSQEIEVTERLAISDDLEGLKAILGALCGREEVNLILTTGGTGFAPRDNTPEATRAVIEREAPGIAEAMRRETASKTPMSMLSRGVAGIRGKTLIINLPGSPKAVEECFEVIRPVLHHAIDLLDGNTKH